MCVSRCHIRTGSGVATVSGFCCEPPVHTRASANAPDEARDLVLELERALLPQHHRRHRRDRLRHRVDAKQRVVGRPACRPRRRAARPWRRARARRRGRSRRGSRAASLRRRSAGSCGRCEPGGSGRSRLLGGRSRRQAQRHLRRREMVCAPIEPEERPDACTAVGVDRPGRGFPPPRGRRPWWRSGTRRYPGRRVAGRATPTARRRAPTRSARPPTSTTRRARARRSRAATGPSRPRCTSAAA